MPDLRACYFCGETGDGLARRTVLPPALTDDDRVTATLCPRCDRKLSRIVEPLVESLSGVVERVGGVDAESGGLERAAPEDPDADPSPVRGETDETGAKANEGTPAEVESSEAESSETSKAESTDGETRPADGETRPVDGETRPVDGETRPIDDETRPADGESVAAATDLLGAESGDSEPTVSEWAAATRDGPEGSEATAASSGDADGADADPTAIYETIEDEIIVAGETVPDADPADPGAGETGGDGADGGDAAFDWDASASAGAADQSGVTLDASEDAAPSGDPGIGDADGSAVAGTESDDDAGDPMETVTVNPMAFRKVMRLLSNREFPVDRAEFESLASNAYDIEEGDVGAMLDAAVDRGLIGERDGQLLRE